MKSKVIIVPCSDYDTEKIYCAMRTGIRALGGIRQWIEPNQKILVKPNFLTAAAAEKAVTTHPSVIEGMLRILWEDGFTSVSYGDSPGHGSCEGAAKKLDLDESARRYGASRADMETEVLTQFPEGMTAKSFYFTKGVAEADAIINLCKMKTHALERITGAVKNVYGFVCGARKAAGHVTYPNAGIFARMLADIHRATPIRLHVMDAVVAMEGNGPGAGDPISMGLLLFSQDPVAIDTAFCELIHLNSDSVPTCVQGEIMGIGHRNWDNITLVLADPEDGTEEEITARQLQQRFGNPNFRVDRSGNDMLWSRAASFVTQWFRRPVIQKDKCVKCGICVSHCPVPGKAVDFRKGKDHPPVYDYQKCIRCYCCQEMCPKHAIHVWGQRD